MKGLNLVIKPYSSKSNYCSECQYLLNIHGGTMTCLTKKVMLVSIIPPLISIRKILYVTLLAAISSAILAFLCIFSIDIIFPAKFTHKLQNTTVPEGTAAEFFIELNALTSNVFWKKDDKLLSEAERFIIKQNGLRHSLLILDSTLEDSGTYTCLVGRETCSATLNVEESTKPFLKSTTLIFGAKVVAGAAAAVGVAAAALPLAGFTTAGIAASSMAAAAQSYIGCVSAGSAFAALQSAGAAGMALTTKAAIATGGATIAALTSIGNNSTET